MDSIAKEMSPGFKKVANVATDVAGYVSKLFGRGCECEERRKRSRVMRYAKELERNGMSKRAACKAAWKVIKAQ